MRRKLRQRQIPSFGRRMVRVCRETDFSGCCFAWKYDGMGTSEKSLPLSPVSPAERTRLRGAEAPQRKPRAAPAKAGSEGMSKRGFLRAVVSPGNTTAWGRRKKASLCQREVWRECRNEDFSGCYFARKYNCMGTPRKKPPFVTRVASRAHPLAECRGAATEAAHSAGKGRFGGNVETRISPAVVSPGNTTAWGRRKKPPFVTRVASRAHPLAECRGAATEAARSAGKGRFGGNVETRISPAVTSPGNTTAWGRRRNPTARGSCSPRSGGRAP